MGHFYWNKKESVLFSCYLSRTTHQSKYIRIGTKYASDEDLLTVPMSQLLLFPYIIQIPEK